MGFKLNAFLTGAMDERERRVAAVSDAMAAREEKIREFTFSMAPRLAAEEAKASAWNTRYNSAMAATDGNETLSHAFANDLDMKESDLRNEYSSYKFTKSTQAAKKPVDGLGTQSVSRNMYSGTVPTVDINTSGSAPVKPAMGAPGSTPAQEPMSDDGTKRSFMDMLLGRASSKQIDSAVFAALGAERGVTGQEYKDTFNKTLSGKYGFTPPKNENPEAIPPMANTKFVQDYTKTLDWNDAGAQAEVMALSADLDAHPENITRIQELVKEHGRTAKQDAEDRAASGTEKAIGRISKNGLYQALSVRLAPDYSSAFQTTLGPDGRPTAIFTGGGKKDAQNLLVSNILREASQELASLNKAYYEPEEVQAAIDNAQRKLDYKTWSTHQVGDVAPATAPAPVTAAPGASVAPDNVTAMATELYEIMKKPNKTEADWDRIDALKTNPYVIKLYRGTYDKKAAK